MAATIRLSIARQSRPRLEVGLLESHLRADGTLPTVPPRPLTEKQLLENELNEAFPNAQSKEIVTRKGQKYQRRFWPLNRSRSSMNHSGKILVRTKTRDHDPAVPR